MTFISRTLTDRDYPYDNSFVQSFHWWSDNLRFSGRLQYLHWRYCSLALNHWIVLHETGHVSECIYFATWDTINTLYSAVLILLSQFSPKSSQKTPHTSPDRERYEVSILVSLHSDICSDSVTVVLQYHIDGLVQERCNSIANALELHLSCTNLLILCCTTIQCHCIVLRK